MTWAYARKRENTQEIRNQKLQVVVAAAKIKAHSACLLMTMRMSMRFHNEERDLHDTYIESVKIS